MNPKNSRILDPMRQCSDEVKTVLMKKDMDMGDHKVSELRQYDRLQYQIADGVELMVHHPGGSSITYLTRPYNISKGGIGLLHGSFLHLESRCEAAIRMPSGQINKMKGRISRCIHVSGKIHDIGMQFDNLMECGWYEDEPEDEEAPKTDLPQFDGKILLVTDSRVCRELLRHMFDHLGVNLTIAGNSNESLELVSNHLFDMLFVSIWLGDGKGGLTFVRQLRELKFPFAIIGLGAAEGEPNHDEAIAAGCEMAMPVPQDYGELIPMLKRYLRLTQSGSDDSAPLVSERWGEDNMRRLILSYVEELDDMIGELRQAMMAQKKETASRLCEDIRASARGYGYPSISSVAANLLEMFLSEQPAEEQRGELEELINLCRQASHIKTSADVRSI